MTVFTINRKWINYNTMHEIQFSCMVDLQAWVKQNNADCMDCIEGVLLDNMWYACKRGECFVFERYVNPNTSNYVMYFFPYRECINSNPDYTALVNQWNALQEEVEQYVNA